MYDWTVVKHDGNLALQRGNTLIPTVVNADACTAGPGYPGLIGQGARLCHGWAEVQRPPDDPAGARMLVIPEYRLQPPRPADDAELDDGDGGGRNCTIRTRAGPPGLDAGGTVPPGTLL